jgi:predicted ribosome quality control (RQC) complex YloA/Tae2 family protein
MENEIENLRKALARLSRKAVEYKRKAATPQRRVNILLLQAAELK